MKVATDVWAAPRKVRRFQKLWKGHISGPMHVGRFHKFTRHGTFHDWVPACMTQEQEEQWSLRGVRGRALSASATAPITCGKCIEIAGPKDA